VPLLNAIRSIVISGDPVLSRERPYEAAFLALLASGAIVRREGWQKVLAVALATLFITFIVMAGLRPG
jgi:hypothetical protein